MIDFLQVTDAGEELGVSIWREAGAAGWLGYALAFGGQDARPPGWGDG